MTGLQAPDLLRGLRRHWGVVVLVTALGCALGAVGTLLIPDTYVSRAEIRILHDSRLDILEDEPSDTYETVDEANRRMRSAAIAAMSDDVVGRTARVTDMSAAEVREHVTVEPLAGADVLVVSASADEPDVAVRLARAATDAFVTSTREAGREQLRDAAQDLEAESEDILADAPDPVPAATTGFTDQLYARALELRTRASLYQGIGEVVREAQEPSATAAPGPLLGARYGLAAGFVGGVAVALLLSMRRTGRPAPTGSPGQPVLAGRP